MISAGVFVRAISTNAAIILRYMPIVIIELSGGSNFPTYNLSLTLEYICKNQYNLTERT